VESIEILGIASALLALAAFVGNQYHKLKDTSIWYDSLNFLSGIGLLFYAYWLGALPFMITNTVWALVSGIDVGKYLLRRNGLKKKGK